MVSIALKSYTAQDIMLQNIQKQRSNIAKLQQSVASEAKYSTTADMSDQVRNKFMELGSSSTRIIQQQGNASQFLAKVSDAMKSVDTIQQKISSSLPGLLAQYRTIDATANTLLTTEIKNILQTMQVEMNSSYSGGGYLFASSADSSVAPIGDIVNNVNYGPDNVPNTNYVNNTSISNKITVADGMSFNTDLNPGDPAFRDTIAALHMMLDALGAGATTMPVEVLNLFDKSQAEMSSFLASNLEPLKTNIEGAIEKNDSALDNIISQIEESFQVDPMEISSIISNIKALLELSLGILSSMNNLPRLLDMIRA